MPTAWIGEEVVLKDKSFHKAMYSVIAETQVTLLQISRREMLEHLPLAFVENIRQVHILRKKQFKRRIRDIKASSE